MTSCGIGCDDLDFAWNYEAEKVACGPEGAVLHPACKGQCWLAHIEHYLCDSHVPLVARWHSSTHLLAASLDGTPVGIPAAANWAITCIGHRCRLTLTKISHSSHPMLPGRSSTRPTVAGLRQVESEDALRHAISGRRLTSTGHCWRKRCWRRIPQGLGGTSFTTDSFWICIRAPTSGWKDALRGSIGGKFKCSGNRQRNAFCIAKLVHSPLSWGCLFKCKGWMTLAEMRGNVSKERKLPRWRPGIQSKGSTGRKFCRMFETTRWDTLLANFESSRGRDYMLEEHIWVLRGIERRVHLVFTHRRTWKLPRCLFLLVFFLFFWALFLLLVVCCFHFEASQVFCRIPCVKTFQQDKSSYDRQRPELDRQGQKKTLTLPVSGSCWFVLQGLVTLPICSCRIIWNGKVRKTVWHGWVVFRQKLMWQTIHGVLRGLKFWWMTLAKGVSCSCCGLNVNWREVHLWSNCHLELIEKESHHYLLILKLWKSKVWKGRWVRFEFSSMLKSAGPQTSELFSMIALVAKVCGEVQIDRCMFKFHVGEPKSNRSTWCAIVNS